MALLDNGGRPRGALPSIGHLDLDKLKSDKGDNSRFSIMSGLNISTTSLNSPAPMYSGPPPPYSCASSTLGSAYVPSGYLSPAESATRRSIRDDKESPSAQKSLPSIHEALGEKTMMPAPSSIPQPHVTGSLPAVSMSQTFPDAPRGPPNPFSQPALPKTTSQDATYTYQPTNISTYVDQSLSKPPPAGPSAESTPRAQQPYQFPASPRPSISAAPRSSISSFSGLGNYNEGPAQSPYQNEHASQRHSFPEYPPPSVPEPPQDSSVFRFEAGSKFEDSRNPFSRSNPPAPYGETVKRHLDIYDAEIALNEINDGCARTLDFSRFWSQRFHQSNRSNQSADAVPSIHEVEDAMRQSQRVVESLGRIRDIVIMQQTALSEERARAATNTRMNDDYHNHTDEYKSGGFAGGDAKKRRGKAAPPGRCHSCNRAETPEWRRGPDGARTLCNACGLHYAKLTRKMGANKASSLTGSSLRPKSLDTR